MSDPTYMTVCAVAALVMLACPVLLMANEHAQRDVPDRAPTRRTRRWHMPQWSYLGIASMTADWWLIVLAYIGTSLIPAAAAGLYAPDGLERIRVAMANRRDGWR